MQSLKYILIWFLMIVIVAISYESRNSILNSKYLAVFMPYKSYVNSDGGIEFQKSKNGHFYIQAEINNKLIKFLLDTGATDVILTEKDAASIGINLKEIEYLKTYQTANGSIKAGSIVIPEIKIGKSSIKNIRASINKSNMSNSLLGMSFLKHFNFTIKDDTLILYPY